MFGNKTIQIPCAHVSGSDRGFPSFGNGATRIKIGAVALVAAGIFALSIPLTATPASADSPPLRDSAVSSQNQAQPPSWLIANQATIPSGFGVFRNRAESPTIDALTLDRALDGRLGPVGTQVQELADQIQDQFAGTKPMEEGLADEAYGNAPGEGTRTPYPTPYIPNEVRGQDGESTGLNACGSADIGIGLIPLAKGLQQDLNRPYDQLSPMERLMKQRQIGASDRKEERLLTLATVFTDESPYDKGVRVFEEWVTAAFDSLDAEAAWEQAIKDAADLPANATKAEVEAAIKRAEEAREKADAARRKADEARKKVEQSDSGVDGGGSLCEERDWFRSVLPQAVGSEIDLYGRIDLIQEYTPENPCGPNANPSPEGGCEGRGEYAADEIDSPTSVSINPDCFEEGGCGRPAISDAVARQIREMADPLNSCGPYANPGEDTDCTGDEEEEAPAIPLPDGPDCAFCSNETPQFAVVASSGSVNTMMSLSTVGSMTGQRTSVR